MTSNSGVPVPDVQSEFKVVSILDTDLYKARTIDYPTNTFPGVSQVDIFCSSQCNRPSLNTIPLHRLYTVLRTVTRIVSSLKHA